MKTEAIKLMKGPYGYKYAKTQSSKVFLPIELEDGIYNKINSSRNVLEQCAKVLDKPIQFVPKGEKATLMNVGPHTTVLRNNDLSAKIAQQMYDIVQKAGGEGIVSKCQFKI